MVEEDWVIKGRATQTLPLWIIAVWRVLATHPVDRLVLIIFTSPPFTHNPYTQTSSHHTWFSLIRDTMSWHRIPRNTNTLVSGRSALGTQWLFVSWWQAGFYQLDNKAFLACSLSHIHKRVWLNSYAEFLPMVCFLVNNKNRIILMICTFFIISITCSHMHMQTLLASTGTAEDYYSLTFRSNDCYVLPYCWVHD